jgi:hypothetical protein
MPAQRTGELVEIVKHIDHMSSHMGLGCLLRESTQPDNVPGVSIRALDVHLVLECRNPSDARITKKSDAQYDALAQPADVDDVYFGDIWTGKPER